jgi:hypothetical protein
VILTLLSFAIALKSQDQNLLNSKETKRLQKNYINESYFFEIPRKWTKLSFNIIYCHEILLTIVKFLLTFVNFC